MRIATWNVNGLRAVLSKDAFKWVEEVNLDVLCLQEIKTRPDQIDQDYLSVWDRWHLHWNPAERAGYSGVATFCRSLPEKHFTSISRTDFDQEGRVVCTRHADFWLFNVYFPNGQRDHGRLTYKLNFYAHLLDLVDDLQNQGEQVIICGDFNTAHQEIDLRNPKQNANTSGFLLEEREWIDRYLAHGLKDVYRELYPDRVQYTWWTYRMGARQKNIGWRLDYFLITECLFERVSYVKILEDVYGSDHCPVVLEIE